jgi:hypothetical protein
MGLHSCYRVPCSWLANRHVHGLVGIASSCYTNHNFQERKCIKSWFEYSVKLKCDRIPLGQELYKNCNVVGFPPPPPFGLEYVWIAELKRRGACEYYCRCHVAATCQSRNKTVNVDGETINGNLSAQNASSSLPPWEPTHCPHTPDPQWLPSGCTPPPAPCSWRWQLHSERCALVRSGRTDVWQAAAGLCAAKQTFIECASACRANRSTHTEVKGTRVCSSTHA